MNRQTYLAKNQEIDRKWWVIDAEGQSLGRLSSKIAMILMGKTKPEYTPHHDVGDFVVVINAEKIKLTGKKGTQKLYRTYSGHPSGQKTYTYDWMIEHKPELLISESVRRMLPKNKLAAQQISKLKAYRGTEHPHQAQLPEPLPA